MPTRIAIVTADQNPHRDRSLGITRMTGCLLPELARFNDLELTALASRSSWRPTVPGIAVETLPWRTDSGLARLATDNGHPFLARDSRRFGLWYYPKGYLPLVHRRGARTAVTIHDTILQHYADTYPGHRSGIGLRYWIGILKHTLRKADTVMAVSETARMQIEAFRERHGLPQHPVHVTWEASDWEIETPAAALDKRDYALHLASAAPHKRTHQLLTWWAQMAKERNTLPPLKLVGKPPPESEPLIAATPEISRLPFQEDASLIDAIRRARVLLLPSEIEGFGLPALEAYYLGTPVCFVEGTSVDEILGSETSEGRFSLSSRDSFASALDDALAMDHDAVLRVGAALRKRFSRKNFARAVHDALIQNAP